MTHALTHDFLLSGRSRRSILSITPNGHQDAGATRAGNQDGEVYNPGDNRPS